MCVYIRVPRLDRSPRAPSRTRQAGSVSLSLYLPLAHSRSLYLSLSLSIAPGNGSQGSKAGKGFKGVKLDTTGQKQPSFYCPDRLSLLYNLILSENRFHQRNSLHNLIRLLLVKRLRSNLRWQEDRERFLGKPTGPNPLEHRDGLVDRPRAMGG